MTSAPVYRALTTVAMALLLASCGGNSGTADPAKQVLPGSSATANADDDGMLPGPGQVVEAEEESEALDVYDESAKSFRPTGLTGTTTRQVVVARDVGTSPDPQIFTLSAVTAAEQSLLSQSLATSDADGTSKRTRTGFGRFVTSGVRKADTSNGSAAEKSSVTASSLTWTTLPTGWKVAATGVKSSGAKGMRVGLRVQSMPNKALVRFYSPSSSTMVQLLGTEVASAIAAKANDPEAKGKGIFWGSVTPGDTSIVEFALPPGVSSDLVQAGIDQVVHMVVSQEQVASKSVYDYEGLDYAGPCQQDAVCTIGSAASTADAVLQLSLLEYDNFGLAGSYMCTGTLIGDNASTGIPYVLTSNHCVAKQYQASDMLATAFFRTSSCGATSLDERAVDFWGRWEYLYSERRYRGTDVSLLRMNLWQSLPDSILLAGWDASYVSSSPVTSFHHAAGSPLKISTGTATWGDSSYLKVSWTGQGTTEPGSSGAALLNGNNQVIGTLWGGQSACASSAASTSAQLDYGNGLPDYYGRFSVAYARGMRRWLNMNAQTVWAAADMNGDGRRELLFQAPVKGGLGLRTYIAGEVDPESGEIAEWRVVDAGLAMTDESPEALAVVDVDGDGREDIVFRAKESDGTYAIRMMTLREEEVDGSPSLVAYAPTLWDRLSRYVQVVGVGRIDDDETADLVLTDTSSSERELVTVLLHPSELYPGEFIGDRYAVPLIHAGYRVVGVGNFSGDQRVEVLFQNLKNRSIGLAVEWQAEGGYAVNGAQPVDFAASQGRFIGLADLDGNGYLDLLGISYGRLYYNVNSASSSSLQFTDAGASLPSRPSLSSLVSLADIDQDGLADQVWRRNSTGQIWVSRSSTGTELQLTALSVTQ